MRERLRRGRNLSDHTRQSPCGVCSSFVLGCRPSMFYWRKSVEKLTSSLLGMLALEGTEEAAKCGSAQGSHFTFNQEVKQSEGKQSLS